MSKTFELTPDDIARVYKWAKDLNVAVMQKGLRIMFDLTMYSDFHLFGHNVEAGDAYYVYNLQIWTLDEYQNLDTCVHHTMETLHDYDELLSFMDRNRKFVEDYAPTSETNVTEE